MPVLQIKKLRGVIVGMPALIRSHTRFLLRSQRGVWQVIRTNCYRQMLDMVFLRPGQTVEVTGVPQEDHKFMAQRIMITDAGPAPEKEETAYGDSSQGGTGSGN